MSFTNPQIPIENPKRHYDKFGFLVAAEQNDNREAEYAQKSRHRRTSPEFGGRNNNREGERFSPNRRERDNYNRSDRNDREGRRRKRNYYSPTFNSKGERPDRANKRDDRMDFDSWETSYNPSPNFVTAPPPPSYTNEPPPSYVVPPAYSQFTQPQYNSFLDGPRQEPVPDMGVPAPPPAPTLQLSNWAPTPPALNTQEDKVKREE